MRLREGRPPALGPRAAGPIAIVGEPGRTPLFSDEARGVGRSKES